MSTWSKQTGKACRKSAKKRWGDGWCLLSDEQREAFLAYEVVKILLMQDDGHASEQVKRLQEVARVALEGETP